MKFTVLSDSSLNIVIEVVYIIDIIVVIGGCTAYPNAIYLFVSLMDISIDLFLDLAGIPDVIVAGAIITTTVDTRRLRIVVMDLIIVEYASNDGFPLSYVQVIDV